MVNYKDERYHDDLLIQLTKDLDELNRLDILSNVFYLGKLGKLKHSRAKRRKDFDVELTFSNLSMIIETKVDSDEGGRRSKDEWQTDEIVKKVSNSKKYSNPEYFFITYGTSEFYTKPYEPGAASDLFSSIGLDKMIDLVGSALNLPLKEKDKYQEWFDLMLIEQKKRLNAIPMLKSFSNFRNHYLTYQGDIDFPNNRLLFCAPELAFPAYGLIASEWNKSKHAKMYGKVELCPIARRSPHIHDSLLRFLEMRESGKPELGKSLYHKGFYLEINEDFNLNLKFNSEGPKEINNKVHNQLKNVKWPQFVNARPRNYKQKANVCYEFDFGLLNTLDDMPFTVDKLGATVTSIVKALS